MTQRVVRGLIFWEVGGWCYHLEISRFNAAGQCVEKAHESDTLPHKRRDASIGTLAKALRRAYRETSPDLARALNNFRKTPEGYRVTSEF